MTTATPEQEAIIQGVQPFLPTIMRWAFPDDVPYSYIEFPADMDLGWAQTQYAQALDAYRRVRDANLRSAPTPAPAAQPPVVPQGQPPAAPQQQGQAPVCPVHPPRHMKFFPAKGDWGATYKCTQRVADGYCDQRVAV